MSAEIIIAEISAYIQSSSTTSNTIGTGRKTFILATDIAFISGMTVTADAGSGNTITGTIYSYSSSILILDVVSIAGSGTFSSWVIGGVNIFRYSTTPNDRMAGFRTGVGEVPPLAVYLPRLINPGNLSRFLFQQGTTLGRSEVGFGNIVIDNSEGDLDGFIDYGFDGQNVIIRKGNIGAAYPSGFTTLFSGTMSQAEFNWNTITIVLRDSLALVYSKPIQPLRFLGTGGIEGGADLEAKTKPIGWGQFFNATVPLVDFANYIYLVNTNQMHSIDNVYDEGIALTPGIARASLALLQSNTPTPGTYDYYLGASGDGCYMRLATDLTNGGVTVDGTEGATSADRTMAQIANRIYVNQGAYSSISSASITALDTANSAVLGIWIGLEERNIRDVLDEIFNSGGATDFPSRDGIINFTRLELPTGTAEQNYQTWQVIDSGNGIERITSNDTGNGLPVYQIIQNYQKNYTVQSDADLAGGVSLERRVFLKKEYRTVASTDATILALHALANILTLTSLFIDQADAQTESDRRLIIYKTRRDMLQITIASMFTDGIELNDVVQLTIPRFTWTNGKKFRVLGITEDYATQFTTLTVWG